jgi:uncharacterized protein
MITQDMLPAMQGVCPSALCTCSKDGNPNAAIISQVYYVNEDHVALSFQFFNKTKRNIMENPKASVEIIHPHTMDRWMMEIEFEHSETEGPLFDEMDMQLEAIASMSGMSDIFKLRAADVYKVHSVTKMN